MTQRCRCPWLGTDRGRTTGVRAGRQRRGAGIIVLAGLLVTLIVVAAVRDRRLPGNPTAAPVPAAPRVGDCIQENPHDRAAPTCTRRRHRWRLCAAATARPPDSARWCPWHRAIPMGSTCPTPPSTSAFSRRTATSGYPHRHRRRSFPSDRRSRCGSSWSARTTGNARPGRTGRRAWCSCPSPPMRPHRSPSITRCGAPGTGRKTADCSPSACPVSTASGRTRGRPNPAEPHASARRTQTSVRRQPSPR